MTIFVPMLKKIVAKNSLCELVRFRIYPRLCRLMRTVLMRESWLKCCVSTRKRLYIVVPALWRSIFARIRRAWSEARLWFVIGM